MAWTIPRIVFVLLVIVFGGDAVAIPVVLSGPSSFLDHAMLVILILLATLGTDSLWYSLGRMGSTERLLTLPLLRRRRAFINAMLLRFDAHPFRYIFLSKFVYGTRASLQLVAGLRRAAYLPVMGASLAGALLWLAVLLLLFVFIELGLARLRFVDTVGMLAVGIAALLALTVVVHRYVSPWLREDRT